NRRLVVDESHVPFLTGGLVLRKRPQQGDACRAPADDADIFLCHDDSPQLNFWLRGGGMLSRLIKCYAGCHPAPRYLFFALISIMGEPVDSRDRQNDDDNEAENESERPLCA